MINMNITGSSHCTKCGEPLFNTMIHHCQPSEEKEWCGCEADEWGIEHTIKAHVPNSTALEWEERFDKKFETYDEDGNYMTMVIHSRKEIKSFISKLLSSQREEIIKEINQKSKFLETDPEVLSGALVFKNSRLAIDTILTYISLGYDIKDLKEAYPTMFEYLDKLSRRV